MLSPNKTIFFTCGRPSREGVSSGGNGLSLRPRDLLKFGVLHLQDGVWEGEQVLPGGWVQKASALHVRRAISGEWNGKELVAPSPDVVTEEGYGYQFWTTEDGIYSASGIFGQECMVFPRHGGVVVVLGAMGDGTDHDLPGMLRATFRAAFGTSAPDPSEVDAVASGWPARGSRRSCPRRRSGPASRRPMRSKPTSRGWCPSASP
ncbi:MAG TPA: hypothetical protein VG674_14820 [Amycolatopsis sp.]|nr:hypothetical protein [Amycolatopsis sp.]